MYKLPVWDTIRTVYGFIWYERVAWFKFALAVLALVIVGVVFMSLPFFGIGLVADQEDPIGGGGTAALFVFAILFIVAYVAIFLTFTVAWHRHYLLWPEPTPVRELLIWKRRHWVFLGRSLAIGIVGVITYLVLGAIVAAVLGPLFLTGQSNDPATIFSIGTFAKLFAIQYIIISLALIVLAGLLLSLPAAAIEDGEIGLRQAMAISRGNRMRMGGVLILGSLLPFHAIQFVIEMILLRVFLGDADDPFVAMLEMSASPTVQIGGNFVSFFFSFLGIAVGISMLSACYHRLRDNIPLERETSA